MSEQSVEQMTGLSAKGIAALGGVGQWEAEATPHIDGGFATDVDVIEHVGPSVVCPHDPPCRRLDSGWPACAEQVNRPGQTT